ncbi:MAG: branched-chain amino acid ABC transporter permease [Caldilineae bacterium]|nr:MAG: branched-chain amino acid ABC transporter permease [Caldilineae bacterium]
MEHASYLWYALLWLIGWGVVGAVVTPRIYSRKDLDISQAGLAGAATGAAGGPFTLLPLWYFTPKLDWKWVALPGAAVVAIFGWAFALADPNNLCVTNGSFVATQLVNGLVMGTIYGLMALGLTLIFSILGVVSFAHGEFYMLGGMAVYYLSEVWFPGIHPVLSVLGAALFTFVIGVIFERIFLRAMNTGQVERPGEYAILVTFGLAFFLQYFTLALVGANPKKVDRFFEYPTINIPADNPTLLKVTPASIKMFDHITISSPRFTAAMLSVLLLAALMWFLYRTWVGKALRAVSQDRQAAAVTGVNPHTMNTLAFGLGAMLAGLSGASLVQVFSWVPWVGILASARAFVIIVLGGMGSLPGAFIGGLIVGVVETLGAGCVPDPQRAAAYIPAYGMVILVLVLLLKPTGLFGREL